MLDQAEVDALVKRIETLVQIHGGTSDKLKKIRNWYAAFARVPEAGAFVALEAEVEKVESGVD
jgi:hypothetical protein